MSLASILNIIHKTRFKGTVLSSLMFAMTLAPSAYGQSGVPEDEYRLAAGYYQRTQYEESASAFNDFLKRYPNHEKAALAQFFYAESKMQTGDYEEAFTVFSQIIDNHPRFSLLDRSTFRMGEAAWQLDKKKIALTSLEHFVRQYPRHELVEYALPYLGELRLKFAEAGLAQKVFETALRLNPGGKFATQNRYGLARSLKMQKQTDSAMRLFGHVAGVEDSPYSALAKLQMGIVSFETDKPQTARKLLGDAYRDIDATAYANEHLEAAYWLARIELESENYEAANKIFSKIDALPSEENLGCGICYDAAIAATNLKKPEVALEWLTKLRRTWPTNRLSDRAFALEIELVRQQQTPIVVLDYCQQFAQRFPQSPLRFNVAEVAGRTQYNQKEYQKSVRTFRDLLIDHESSIGMESFSDDQRQQRMTWFYLKSLGHIGLEKYDEAITDLELAEANLPDKVAEPKLLLALASAWYGKELYEDAATAFEAYLKEEPNEATAVYSRLVVCYANLGQLDKAKEIVGRLGEGDPAKAINAYQYLADDAFKKKRLDIATDLYLLLADSKNEPKYVNAGLAGLSWMMMENLDPETNDIYVRLVKEYPDSEFSSKAAISRARFLEEKNQNEAASELYQLVIKQFPKFELAQVARLRLAHRYQQKKDNKSLLQAKKLTQEFVGLHVSDGSNSDEPSAKLIDEAIYQLGWINRDLGLEGEAQQCFKTVMLDYPESKFWPDVACRCAENAMEDKHPEAARRLLDKVLQHENLPTEIATQAIYLRSKIAATSGDWNSIVTPMSRLAKTTEDPKVKAMASYWQAESLYRTGEFESAGKVFDALQPDTQLLGATLEPWLLLRLAQCHGKSQRWTNAATLARDCLDRFPNFANSYEFTYVLGRAEEYDGVFEEARKKYQQVIDSEDGAGTETAAIAQWRIGETWFHQENYKMAIDAYYKTDSLHDFDQWKSAALLQAGKCQEHLENWGHAAKLYVQLLERHHDTEFAIEASERLARVNQIASKESENKTR